MILSVFCISLMVLFFWAAGLIAKNERIERQQKFVSAFREMFSATDKALLEFSEIDEKYLKGEEGRENYEKAFYILNHKLEEIKKQEGKLDNPPENIKEMVDLYRKGFSQVLSVTDGAVNYLSGLTDDPLVIVKGKDKFVEGLQLLKEVKDKLRSEGKAI